MEKTLTEQEQKRSLPRRLVRLAGKLLAWGLAVLLTLLLLGWLALIIFFPDDKIRTMLTEKMSDTLGMQVTAADLDLEILSGLSLRDVEIVPRRAEPGHPLVKIDRLVMDYSLAEILHKRLVVRRLLVDRPQISIVGRAGRDALAALLSPGESASRPSADRAEEKGGLVIDLERVELQNARIEIVSDGLRADMRNLQATVSGRLGAPGVTRLEADLRLASPEQTNAHMSLGDRKPAATLSAAVGLRLKLEASGKGTLSAAGELVFDRLRAMDLPATNVKLTFSARADLENGTAGIDKLEIVNDGRRTARLQAEITGLYEQPRISLALFDLLLPPGTIAAALRKAWPRVRLGGESISIDSLRFSGDERSGELSIEGGLAAKSVALAGTSLAGLKARLHGRAELQLEPGGPVLSSPELNFEGRLARLVAGGAAFGETQFSGRLGASSGSPAGATELELVASGRTAKIVLDRNLARRIKFDLHLSAGRLAIDPAGLAIAELGGTAGLQAQRISGPDLVINRPVIDVAGGGFKLATGGRSDRLQRLKVAARAGPTLLGPLAADSLAASAETGPGRLGLVFIPLKLKLSARDLRPAQGGSASGSPGSFRLHGETRVVCQLGIFPRAARLKVKQLELGISDIIKAAGAGELDLNTSKFDLELSFSPFRTERLLTNLPAPIAGSLPRIEGEAQLRVKLAGLIPRGRLVLASLPVDANATVLVRDVDFSTAGVDLARISGQIVLHRKYIEKTRQFEARAQLSAAGTTLANPPVDARGLRLSLEAHGNAGDFWLAWKIGLTRLSGGLLPAPLEKVSLSLDSRLLGMKEIRLTNLVLKLPSLGLVVNSEGRLERPAGAGWAAGVSGSGRLDARFVSRRPLAWPGRVTARGQAGISVAVESSAAGVIDARGKISFDGFDLKGDDFSIEGVRGAIPTRQRVAFTPAPILLGRTRRSGADAAGLGTYEEALRPMKGAGRSFSVSSIRFKDLSIEKLRANLELTSGRLMLGSLSFSFLGGDVLADSSLVFAPRPALRLKLDSEMSAIDLSKLGAFTLAGSSDIGGNLHLDIDWPARSVAASVNLTRIGRSTLQALLLAADPADTNPGVLELRRFLSKYQVSPQRVSVDVRHGRLQMVVVLKMGFAARAAARLIRGFEGTSYPIRQLPVGGLLSKYLGFE